MKGDFEKALREAERAREHRTLRQGAAYRISEEVLAGRARRSPLRRRAGLLAAVAALPVLAFLAFRISQPGPAPSPSPSPPRMQLAQPEASAPGPRLPTAPDGQMALGAGDPKFDAALRLHVQAVEDTGAVLVREDAGLRVVQGAARFDVQPRAPGEAEVAVLVSHGRIEVLGTAFTVVQGEDGGEVTLHHGRIRYRGDGDGREVLLAPGESLRWPLPPSAVAEVAPGPAPPPGRQGPRPHPSPRRAPAVDVEALIEELELLRRQGRFEEAVTRLDGVLRGELPEATAERLSYELGSILTWQLRSRERGCAVWAAHRERHGAGGRYAAEVGRAERALGCR
jgi:transmembrane sensor